MSARAITQNQIERAIARAREFYARISGLAGCDDDIEIDEMPGVSCVPGNGIWVQAWVWVPLEEIARKR